MVDIQVLHPFQVFQATALGFPFISLIICNGKGRLFYYGVHMETRRMKWFSSALYRGSNLLVEFYSLFRSSNNQHFQLEVPNYHCKVIVHKILAVSVFVIAVVFVYFGFILGACLKSTRDNVIFTVFSLIYSASFFFIGVTFAIVGTNFYRKLKQAHPEKAREVRFRIFMSISSISISFIMRGLFNLIYTIFDKNTRYRAGWLKDNNPFYPVIMFLYFLISEILPTIFLCLGVRIATNEYAKTQETEEDNTLGLTKFTNLKQTLNDSKGFTESSFASLNYE